ncbi:MAG: SDR family NAD(P)-dependent oxidoreductase [Bacteroidota bacterium]
MRNYRRALVTGATSGIGGAFSDELPNRTDLLLTGRDLQRLSQAADRLTRPGRVIETHPADLTDAGARDRLIEHADAFGVDLLINNAGTGRLGRFLDNPPDVEQETVLLNVVAVVDLTRRLLPGMLERARAGRRRAGLIVVSSTTAFAPVPFFATYAASKTFALQFTEALAEELRGEPIDVLALCPGATRTGFERHAGHRPGNIPAAGEPRDVAAEGLAALGRDTVRVVGRLNQAALGPVVLPRRLVTGAIGLAMRFVTARAG